MNKIDTIIIGGGQAGAAVSYHLKSRQLPHLILEQATQAAYAWREQRWDSFTLLTPNWSIRLPGAVYQGNQPNGFMPRADLVAYFEGYIRQYGLPIRYDSPVNSVRQGRDALGKPLFQVETDQEIYQARHVVIATGFFQEPKIPSYAKKISQEITQLTAASYRRPGQLPDGAVLIVGSAQSGSQIAEELHDSGREVYLSVGTCGRVPRRYRGRDTVEWLDLIGFFDRTADQLSSRQMIFMANPQVSGKDGGHDINLHRFARDGIKLLGHTLDADADLLTFAGDLTESLTKTDQLEESLLKTIDAYIDHNKIDAPPDDRIILRDAYQSKLITELSLAEAGIRSIIWAQGFTRDYSFIKLPVTDQAGFPLTRRGVSNFPGLYFVGMPFLHKMKSGLLMGVGDDAAYIADLITDSRD